MQERPKNERLTGEKRQWSTPKVREIPLTDEILAHFELPDSALQTDMGPARKTAASR